MESEIAALVAYILSRKEELEYWTNEEGYPFVIRNQKLFVEFGQGLILEQWYNAAEIILPQLPEKNRERNLEATASAHLSKPYPRDNTPAHAFTLVLDETKVGHELIIQPLFKDDFEPFAVPVNSTSSYYLKEVFKAKFDQDSRQSQLSI